MRVLHVAQPTEGGLVSCVGDPVADQVRRGWEVFVATPKAGQLPGVVRSVGATHVEWKAERSPGPSVPSETFRLRRLVGDLSPDLVHLHSAKAGLAGRLALRRRLATVFQPQAWSFHAVDGAVRSAAVQWERLAARWADRVVCVSEFERSQGEEAGVKAEWRVVYNGVDVERLTPAGDDDRAAARAALGLGPDPVAVCVGRLSRQKGQDVLLDAWRAVRTAVPAAQLALVGDGEDRPQLERRAADGVLFAGHRIDVPDWLAAADLVVIASRWEGMSLVPLEAMARGRSVVATDVAGSREQLGDDAGAVVPPEDAAALAEAVVERLRDPARAAAEGRAGRARVVRSHDIRQTTEQLAGVYEEILARR